MAFKLAEAFVSIFARDKQLKSDLGRTRQTITQEVGQLQGLLGQLGLGVGGAAGLGLAVKLASDAEEIQSKFEAVFKDLTPQAEEFSSTFANSIGRSVVETKRQMSQFQDTFVPLGFARDRAAELSKQMTTLTADLASFNNITDPEAQEALTSALVGNHEAVRKFGVIITEATLKQELLNMGIEGGVQKASNQEKVMARLAIIMRSTSDAQGDAARTAGSFANRLKGLTGAASDFGAAIGSVLLPPLASMMNTVTGLLRGFNVLNEELDGMPARAAAATAAIAALKGALVAMQLAGLKASSVMRLIFVGTKAGVFIAILGGVVAGLVEIIRWLGETKVVQDAWQDSIMTLQLAWMNFQKAFDQIFQAIRSAVNSAIQFINDTWGLSIDSMADTFSGFVAQTITAIANFVLNVAEWFRVIVDNWDTVVELMKNRGKILLLGLRDSFFQLPRLIAFALGRGIRFFVDAFKFIFNFVAKVIMNIGKILWDFIKGIWNRIKALFTGKSPKEIVSTAAKIIQEEAKKIGESFQTGFNKGSIGDVFEPSPELQAALDKQDRLIGKLQDAKRAVESEREEEIKALKKAEEDKAKIIKKAAPDEDAPKIENAIIKKAEMPTGMVGFTDLANKMQAAFLKAEDPNAKMAGLMAQDLTIQRQNAMALDQIKENTGKQPPSAGG